MQISERTYSTPLKNPNTRVAVVTALFNHTITQALEIAAVTELKHLGVDGSRILTLQVPGAWELPLAAQKLFAGKRTDAIVACGCIIRGDTGHYDIVANTSASGLAKVSLKFGLPIMNAVLTVENIAQAETRAQANHSNKGAEAARSLIELLNNFDAAELNG